MTFLHIVALMRIQEIAHSLSQLVNNCFDFSQFLTFGECEPKLQNISTET